MKTRMPNEYTFNDATDAVILEGDEEDELLFDPSADESAAARSAGETGATATDSDWADVADTSAPDTVWEVLVVDDDREVHAITSLVLQDVVYRGKKLRLRSAYSADEAKKFLLENGNVALIILDVVMETDNAGLELTGFIRREMKNDLVRIILRTGQPGQAPERDVIVNYDINDYKEKTELTSQKLFTATISALRSYEDISKLKLAEAEVRRYRDNLEALVREQTLELGRKNRMLCLEIEERRAAEERRARLEEQMRQTQKMEAIGQLAGGLAHDFKNLITAILGYSYILQEHVSLDGIKNLGINPVAEIIATCNRGTDTIDKMLAFARKGKYENRPVDLHKTIGDIIGLLTHSVEKNIVIKQTLRAESHVTMGDASQLGNALLNLGINARDAMPSGGLLIFATETVRLSGGECAELGVGAEDGVFVKISVTDTGSGMSEDTRKRIFDPFFTTKPIGKGTGLGLSAVYGCVKNHNGAIDVDTHPGQGTTFDIYLPVIEKSETCAPDTELCSDRGKQTV